MERPRRMSPIAVEMKMHAIIYYFGKMTGNKQSLTKRILSLSAPGGVTYLDFRLIPHGGSSIGGSLILGVYVWLGLGR